jgi:hypothetical protein
VSSGYSATEWMRKICRFYNTLKGRRDFENNLKPPHRLYGWLSRKDLQIQQGLEESNMWSCEERLVVKMVEESFSAEVRGYVPVLKKCHRI